MEDQIYNSIILVEGIASIALHIFLVTFGLLGILILSIL